MKTLYHIAQASDWQQAQQVGTYTESTMGKTLENVGYIHMSFAHQVKQVADFIYAGVDNLVLLKVNPDKLLSEVKVESVEGTVEKFPHLYGPLNLNAIEDVLPYPKQADGSFQAVTEE